MDLLHSRRTPTLTEAQRVAARAQIERVAGEVGQGLLAARPEELRRLAAVTVNAARRAEEASASVGDRPPLDCEAEQWALAAFEELQARRTRQAEVARRWRGLAGVGNVVALVSVAVAVVLFSTGGGVNSTLAAVLVAAGAGAPGGRPLLGVVSGFPTGRRVRRARNRLASALEDVGVETLGQVRALRIRFDAWERRRAEAEQSASAAARLQDEWDAVAGPTVAPQHVEAVLRWIERLRSAQLALVAAWLVEAQASVAESDDWLARAAAHRHRFNPPPPPPPPPAELAEETFGQQLLLFGAL